MQTLMNDNIKTPEDVETYLELNATVVVPDLQEISENPKEESSVAENEERKKEACFMFF